MSAATSQPPRGAEPMATASTPPQRTMDDLARMTAGELERLYRGARVPQIIDLAGPLRGRMLAWPALDRVPLVPSLLRVAAGSQAFPWRGKTFAGEGEVGQGVNRLFGDRVRWFPFRTTVARSRAGDFDAVHLNYAVPGNPPVISAIRDEVREVEPGLWLGQAYILVAGRSILWLYFALERAS